MTDDEFTPDADLDARLRAAMSHAVPDAPAIGVIGDVERRAVRRKRRVRESVAAGLVVMLGGGAAIGYGLNSGPQRTFAGPAATSTTSTSTTTPARATAAQSQEIGPGQHNGGLLHPSPAPCRVDQQTPTMATGSYCGPAPHAGNGAGPDGTCTGTETTPPCGPGVVPRRYYAYTMPGTCKGLITFAGKQWVSELPPPSAEPDFYVWMSLGPNGGLGWIGPNGAVGFQPYVGQALKACGR
jgi:hypothetical protein